VDKETKEEFPGATVFGQLPEEKWNELFKAVEYQVAAARTIIFRQGDPGDRFYVVRSGKVRVFRKDARGLETDLSILGPGESFGEMALLTGEARSANVETIDETSLMVLSKEQFERILKDFPDITLAFVKQMSVWLLRDEKIIEKEAQQQRQAPRVSLFDFILLVGVSVIIAFLFNGSNPNGIAPFSTLPDTKTISPITPAQAMEDLKKGDTVMVDAGPEGFYQRKHIQGAINVPLALSDILYEVTFQDEQKGKKVIVYGGTFSKRYDWELASKLLRRGHKDVRVLEGGTSAWVKAGYPMDTWEEKK
jgi:CRP-like cAMP-binding protein